MAYDLSDDFRRPLPLALAALAIVGWLLVSYFWSQAADVRVQMDDALKRAEQARAGMAAELQNIQKAAGDVADLQKQETDAQKALADAVTARASAQNELSDLTKQISEARLAVSGAQEEASAKTRDLQSVDAKLKGEADRLSALESQIAARSDAGTQAEAALDAKLKSGTDQLSALEGQIAAAQAQFAELQRRNDDAARNLADLEAKAQAAQQRLDAALKAQEDAKPQ
jgi:chromosome segregation ATPase